jgi:hypothetical protein
MKLTLKTTLSMLAVVLTFASSPVLSMDEIQESGLKVSQLLPMEIQKCLTDVGHTVLGKILYEDDFDISKSGFFEKVYPQLEPYLGEAQYSALASWAPSNYIRWAFSSADQNYIATRKNQIIAILGLGWAMTDLAKQQGDFFERGSFTIIDPDHRLTNFLLDYVKLTTGYQDPQTVPFVLTSCNFAYRRDPSLHGSSHHNGRCPESQFGIDVRFEPSEGVLKLLPFDYTHLLFAKLNVGNQEEPLLFLKLEDLGMGSLGATTVHSLGFLHSQSHVATEARREKDIGPTKEMAATILSLFKDLQEEANVTGDFKTIRSMVLEAQKILDTETQSKVAHEKARKFLIMLDELYPNGNNHLRVGNEVIIDLKNRKNGL